MSARAAIVFAYDYPPAHHTGMGTHVHELARGLGERGVTCHVLVPRTDETPSAEDEALPGVVVHRVQMAERTRALDRYDRQDPRALLVAANDDLHRYAAALIDRGLRPDLLHVHDFFFVPAAFRLREERGVPVVATVHMAFDPLQTLWGQEVPAGIGEVERAMCAGSDAVITVSRSMAAILARTHGIPEDRIDVVYNGFASEGFTAPDEPAGAVRARYGLDDGPVVVYAGRISPQKGVLELVRSAAAVVARHPTAQWVLAGLNPAPDLGYGERVRAAIAEHPGLRDRVRWLGRIDRTEVAALYRIAALAVVPSAYEPFGYAATEAMAAGVPVVAAASGGLAEIVEPGSGLAVPVHSSPSGALSVDVEALAEAQSTLLADPALAAATGARGRARVAERFTVARMVAETAAVYDRVAR